MNTAQDNRFYREPAIKDRPSPTMVEIPEANNLPAVREQSPPPKIMTFDPGPPTERKIYPPKIAQAILTIMRDIGAIQKGEVNKDLHYAFQAWDDILARLSPMLAEHGLIPVQTEAERNLLEDQSLVAITYEFTIVNADGDCWPPARFSALSKVRAKSGFIDDKAINKCHTQAAKYYLINLFKIRTKDVDDSDRGDSSEEIPQKISHPQGPKIYSRAEKAKQDWEDKKNTFIAAIGTKMTVDDLHTWGSDMSVEVAGFPPEHKTAIYAAFKARMEKVEVEAVADQVVITEAGERSATPADFETADT